MRAAVGSAHRHPGPALRSSPIKRMADKQAQKSVCLASARIAAFPGSLATFFFCPREKWHRDEGNTGQENSGNAVLRSFSAHEIGNGLITDVNSQCQEADPTILRLSFSFRSRV